MALVREYKFGSGDPTFDITVELVNPEQWESWMHANEKFQEYYKELFRDCIFEIHRYLIRVTPVMSGRLRAGWTGILNKYNVDYTRAFTDTSLLDHAYINWNQQAIMEGMAESQWMDADFDVSIINSVPYSEMVEFGTSKMSGQYFTNKARYKGEYILTKAIDDWFKEITAKAELVKAPKVEEVAA